MKKIEFYYDISSPYSYLAHEQIKLFEKNNKFSVTYMPILLGWSSSIGKYYSAWFKSI